MKKEKKILFSPEIDGAINGYAIGATFLGLGIFLLFQPQYFIAPIASYAVGAVLGLFGAFGIGVELSKSAKVKGLDNIVIGAVFIVTWLLLYLKIHSSWINIISFLLVVIGCYALFLGLFQGMYSIINNIKANKAQKKEHPEQSKNTGSLISQIVLFLTQLCGLGLAIVNIIKALGTR